MNIDLSFKDESQEKAYNSNLKGNRRKYMIFYFVGTFLYSLIIWFLNPHELESFQGLLLRNNLVNVILFLITCVLLYYKKIFNEPHIGIFLLQVYTCVGYIENSRVFEDHYNRTSYICKTIMMENMILISMIARCNWKFNAVVSFIINFYLSFRFLDFKDNETMKGYPLIVLLGNFIVNSLACYLGEKYDRGIYIQKNQADLMLRRFENIIKEVIPTAILISREKEFIFFNKEAESLLNFNKKSELNDILKGITIKEGKSNTHFETEKSKDTKLFAFKDTDEDYIKPLKKKETLFNRLSCESEWSSLNHFKTYKGKQRKDITSACPFIYLDIKIGIIVWEGKPALMMIMSEDAISQQVRFLKEQALFKDKLLATVSHDLRTPLNGMIGMIEVSLEGVLERGLRKNLQLALRSSKLLQFLINDILDFTQMSNQRLSLNSQKFNVFEVMKDVSKLIKFQAKRKGLKFLLQNNVVSKTKNKIYFKSDPNRLKQIILNLLSNALKFTEEGYIQLTIDNPESNTAALRFSVSDTGCGMRPEEISQLFHVFGKLRNSDNKRLNLTGIGLGLAISQNLVRHMNGFAPGFDIKVSSEYGRGSIFSFVLLPFNENKMIVEDCLDSSECILDFEDAENGVNLIPFSKTKKEFIRETNKKIRVLLVDDDQINILVLTSYFKSFWDCEYDTAFHGKQAIDLIKKNAEANCFYDIIFTDINMPIMDGFEAAKIINGMVEQGTLPKLKIIATTANSFLNEELKLSGCGIEEYLPKPFTRDQIRRKIDEWKGKL